MSWRPRSTTDIGKRWLRLVELNKSFVDARKLREGNTFYISLNSAFSFLIRAPGVSVAYDHKQGAASSLQLTIVRCGKNGLEKTETSGNHLWLY